MKVTIDEKVIESYMQSVEELKLLLEQKNSNIAELLKSNSNLTSSHFELTKELNLYKSLLFDAHSAMRKLEQSIDIGIGYDKSKYIEQKMASFSVLG